MAIARHTPGRWAVPAGAAIMAVSAVVAVPAIAGSGHREQAKKPTLASLAKQVVSLRSQDATLRRRVSALSKVAGVAGSIGTPGARGPQGLQGPQGAQGPQGIQGPAGPITGTLPAGVTLRGWFNLDTVAAGADQINGGSISFGFSLSALPAVTIIPVGGAPTAGCPGSVAAPAAARGNLCIYEGSILNNHDPGTDGGFASGDQTAFGTELFFHSAAAGRFFVDGTWAVTGS